MHGPWSVYLGERGRGDRPPDWLAKWDGDGIIARIENRSIARALEGMRVPVVDLSAAGLLPRAPVVTTDNAAIARLAVQHFTERGFRHFGYCGEARFAWSVARGKCFSLFARTHGHTCAIYTRPGSRVNSDEEVDAIARWLRRLPKPAAVFACYDACGQRVLDACRRAGLAVPEEVAVLGVDNDELLCALSPPPLSSICLNTPRTGWQAAALLARMMGGEKVPAETQRVPPLSVVTRQSTDVLAVGDPPVARALHYIRAHACDGLGVSDVLRHCLMARRTLEARLKALLGRTPREEIARVQLGRVKELLAGTDLALAEIAGRAGFRHTEYLSVFLTGNGADARRIPQAARRGRLKKRRGGLCAKTQLRADGLSGPGARWRAGPRSRGRRSTASRGGGCRRGFRAHRGRPGRWR